MVQKELLIYPTFMSPEEFNSALNSALDLYASYCFAISRSGIIDAVQMRYARSFSDAFSLRYGKAPS